MLSAVAGKTGLAPRVSLLKLRRFLQHGQNGQPTAKADAASTEAQASSLSAVAGSSSNATRADGEGLDGVVLGSSTVVPAAEGSTEIEKVGAEGMTALRVAVTEVPVGSIVAGSCVVLATKSNMCRKQLRLIRSIVISSFTAFFMPFSWETYWQCHFVCSSECRLLRSCCTLGICRVYLGCRTSI